MSSEGGLGRVLQRLGAGSRVETEGWAVRRLMELGALALYTSGHMFLQEDEC